MKMNLNFLKSLNKLLANQVVLYVVMFLSLTNLIGYISLNDTTSVLVFLITGMITSYYTGNMVLVLLMPMVITNLLYGMDRQMRFREGMKNKNENGEKNNKKNKKQGDKKAKSSKKNKKNKELDDTHMKIDDNATYEDFFKGLGNNVNGENLEKMTNQTKKLIESQMNLKEAMGQLTPMVDNAKKMMKNLGDMSKLTGFEGFDTKNMNASIKKMMNQFMNSEEGEKNNK
jgi:Sec-independent protein translocase protein TatA